MQTPIFYNKTKRKGLLRAIIGCIFTIAGILALILPLATVSGIENITKNLISLSAGGVSLIFGFCMLISGMTQWMVRPYAVVLTTDGLYNFTGKHKNGMFIEWNNIKDSKVCGKGESAYIGIDLVSLEIAYKSISKKEKREISENISNNMPAVMINQSEVSEPIGSIVKTVLQIRLGTKADLFDADETESSLGESDIQQIEKNENHLSEEMENTYIPEIYESASEETSEDEKSLFIKNVFEKTGPIEISEDNTEIIPTDADMPEETDVIKNAPLEEIEKVLDTSVSETKEESKTTNKDFSTDTSIDDLLAMLSIGDEK